MLEVVLGYFSLPLNSNQLRSQRLPGVYVLPAAKSPLSKYLLSTSDKLLAETWNRHMCCTKYVNEFILYSNGNVSCSSPWKNGLSDGVLLR